MKFLIVIITVLLTSAAWGQTPAAEVVLPPGTEVYHAVEQMPQYPGGFSAMQAFVRKELKYPRAAAKAGTQGTVYVEVLIDDEGRILTANPIGRKLGNGLEEEALRLIATMPKWIPGKQNGQTVYVTMAIPVVFKLE